MSTNVKAKIGKENYRTVVVSDSHNFVIDEPMSAGGKDLGPNPGELLSAALATCSTATVKMYADRKGWDVDEVQIEVDFKRNLKLDTTTFTKNITITGDLTDEQIEKLHEIAGRCPIHKILTGTIEIKSELI